MYSAKKKGIEASYNLFYWVARGVKSVTVKKLVNQIDFVQGKAKTLLDMTTLVNDYFIKVFYKMVTCPKWSLYTTDK